MTFEPHPNTELTVTPTRIPGLLSVDLAVLGDNRGWFKENYQQAKLGERGLPKDFAVVQNNISYNEKRGVTRGIHAEPWDKYISVAFGSVFAAIVDFRPGETFGTVETFTVDPGKAIFVPRGCGNSFQTLEANTVYTYLVNDYWSHDATYTHVNVNDPDLDITWPIPLDDAEISDKDRRHPHLKDIKPVEVP